MVNVVTLECDQVGRSCEVDSPVVVAIKVSICLLKIEEEEEEDEVKKCSNNKGSNTYLSHVADQEVCPSNSLLEIVTLLEAKPPVTRC